MRHGTRNISQVKDGSFMNKKKYTTTRAFKDLGKIDKAHESGRITKNIHDIRSRKVLRKLVRGG